MYYSNKSALQSLLRVRAAPTRPHNPFIIRAIIDEYLRAYVVPCLIVWSLPCFRHILSHPHIHAHNSARAACAFEGAAGQRATRARSAEGERTWIVLRDRAEARSKVGKSIAERSGEPSVQSVQSVPMPGEEEEDLINLGVAAWRRRGHAVQWRRGAACHQSGGAACHQPQRPPLVAARPGRPPADSGTGLFTVCTVVIVGVGHLGRLRFLDSDGSPPPLPLPLPGWLPAFCPCAL